MMKKFFFRKKKGFTLIELLIVVAIIGIIAGIAVPRFLGVRTKAKVTRAFADMASISKALEMYYTEEDAYPFTKTDGSNDQDGLALLTPDYISSIPNEPFAAAGTKYRYYTNATTTSSATLWLLVSNGPDVTAGVTAPTFANPVASQLGGGDGLTDSHYGTTAWSSPGVANSWSPAKDSRDLGDIGRGGP